MNDQQLLERITSNPALLYLLSGKLEPLSSYFGHERGRSIARYFVEEFLEKNSDVIQGVCLEVKDNKYTERFGGDAVTKSDILDIETENKQANIHGDLRSIPQILDETYDCIILTQVLPYINDYGSALRQGYRILKPGGTVLATVSSLSRIDPKEREDYWRWTKAGAEYTFAQVFGKENIEVTAYGNVLSGLAFWVGMACEDLSNKEILDYHDPQFPVLIAVKAVRSQVLE